MRARLLAATTTAAVLATALSGCITVHGETAVIPAVRKSEAQKVLDHFTNTNNKANKTYDAELNATIEAGALGSIDQAGLRSHKEVHPDGDEDFEPLKLTDPRFLIPQMAGWPKFFVADTKSNRGGENRWFLVFQRDSSKAPWRATYLSVVEPEEMPEFVSDADGYAKEVPPGKGSGLVVPPVKLSRTYTGYLQKGESDVFAAGPHTSEWRANRAEQAEQEGVRTEWADLPAEPPQFAPVGLRTKGGGALVFFASHHQTKKTLAKGYSPEVKDPYVKALMTGTPKHSITYVRVSEQAVTVPSAKSAEKDEGIGFINRITGLTSARGE